VCRKVPAFRRLPRQPATQHVSLSRATGHTVHRGKRTSQYLHPSAKSC